MAPASQREYRSRAPTLPRPDPPAPQPPVLPCSQAPDAMKPGIQCVRTHWIRGFMTFRLARRTWIVRLMVSA
jgi:hypothetical protein